MSRQRKTKEKVPVATPAPESESKIEEPTPFISAHPPSFLSRKTITVILLIVACILAFYFRLHAVIVYGRVIHEFDPWFNFRATQYMVDHGILEFFDWFDEMSWYPIGRHVGSTTYPGLLITSTVLYRFFNLIGFSISINDICVFIPAIFGSITTLFTYGLTKEIFDSDVSGGIAALIMAIIPSHLMRSVAGGYDNESVALAAITSTFYLWVKSIKTEGSWKLAPLTALSYIYMVAAWGGYTFVINMVGLHAGLSFLLGHFSVNMYLSYSIFYFFGTLGAIQFPMVRWLPLQSMEQIMPLLVFLGYQVLGLLEYYKYATKMDDTKFKRFRFKIIFLAGAAGVALFFPLILSGYFGPFSNRVRSLFIPHTRTGNPLVDSVSEHQATAPHYYWQYFHYVYFLGPVGFMTLFYKINPPKVFGILYVLLAYYFSQKMVRLLLILSAPSCMVAGSILDLALTFSFSNLFSSESSQSDKAGKSKKAAKSYISSFSVPEPLKKIFPAVSVLIIVAVLFGGYHFYFHCDDLAHQMSHPQILLQGRNQQGEMIIIDDFMQSYLWLKDHTPADARVMSWWDYGYQINGIANRTTIADGNTWNHEHIALLGKALVSKEKEAWKIARHLADYVLVWTTRFAGMYGDDLAKMPHMANIAGSVYPDVARTGYYIDKDGNPSELMRDSLLYRLTINGIYPDAKLNYFKEAYTSPNRMVRIYKVLNTAPRSPFGQYSPELTLGRFKEER